MCPIEYCTAVPAEISGAKAARIASLRSILLSELSALWISISEECSSAYSMHSFIVIGFVCADAAIPAKTDIIRINLFISIILQKVITTSVPNSATD